MSATCGLVCFAKYKFDFGELNRSLSLTVDCFGQTYCEYADILHILLRKGFVMRFVSDAGV